MSFHRLELLGILGAVALAAPSGAEILNTTSNTQAKNFQKGAGVEKFDDLEAAQSSSYDPNRRSWRPSVIKPRPRRVVDPDVNPMWVQGKSGRATPSEYNEFWRGGRDSNPQLPA